MFDPETLAFFGLVALLSIVPGADTFLLLRNVLSRGARGGILTVIGGRCGLLVHAFLSGLGLSSILLHSAHLYSGVRWAGALVLIGLGVHSLIGAVGPVKEIASPKTGPPFVEGFLTNALNPKTALFYLAVLPQFIRPEEAPLSRSLVLVCFHIGFSTIWFTGLCFLFGWARPLLIGSTPRRVLQGIAGGVLTLLGLRLVLDRG